MTEQSGFEGADNPEVATISLSSGSGKTKVLVELMLRMAGSNQSETQIDIVYRSLDAEPGTATAAIPLDFEDFAANVRLRLTNKVRAIASSCNSDVVEDIVQSALVAVWRYWEEKGSPDNPNAFAVTVAVRLAWKYVEKERKLRRASFAGEFPAHRSADEIAAVPLRMAIEHAVSCLPPRQRAILLFHLEGKANQEIARLLQISPGTVGAQLHAARRNIRDRLDGQSWGQE